MALTNIQAIRTSITAIARSLNVPDTAVIYSTDTVTLLDDVSYIYDASTQTTWGVPAGVGAGEVIVSVGAGGVLTTNSNTYQLAAVITKSTVISVTELQKLDILGSAYLSDGSKSGWFTFTTDDVSAKVTIDTYQGVYIAPSFDQTGASGAWVRDGVSGSVLTHWFIEPLSSRPVVGSYDMRGEIQSAFDLAANLGVALEYTRGHWYHGTVVIPRVLKVLKGTDKGTVFVYGAPGEDLWEFGYLSNTFEIFTGRVFSGLSPKLEVSTDLRDTTYKHRCGPDGENIGNCVLAYTHETLAQSQFIRILYDNIDAGIYTLSGASSSECGACFTNYIPFGHTAKETVLVSNFEYGFIHTVVMARRVTAISGGSITAPELSTVVKLEPQGGGYVLVESPDQMEVGDKMTVIYQQDLLGNPEDGYSESVLPRVTYYVSTVNLTTGVVTLEDLDGNPMAFNADISSNGFWVCPAEDYSIEQSPDAVVHEVQYIDSRKKALSVINGLSWHIGKMSVFYDARCITVFSGYFGGPVRSRTAEDWEGSIYCEGPFNSYSYNDVAGKTPIVMEVSNSRVDGLTCAKMNLTLYAKFGYKDAFNNTFHCGALGARTKSLGEGSIYFNSALPGYKTIGQSSYNIHKTYEGNPGEAAKTRTDNLSVGAASWIFNSNIQRGFAQSPLLYFTAKNSRGTGGIATSVYDEDSINGYVFSQTTANSTAASIAYIGTSTSLANAGISFGADKTIPTGMTQLVARVKTDGTSTTAFFRLQGTSPSYLAKSSAPVAVDGDWVVISAMVDTSALDGYSVGSINVLTSAVCRSYTDWVAVMPPQVAISAVDVFAENVTTIGSDGNKYKLTQPSGAGAAVWELV